MLKPQTHGYSIIPASVRYDKNVPAGAKILYGEINALTQKEGFCCADNEYFATLFEEDEQTIGNWINSLYNNGHIIMETREIKTSVITIPEVL